VTSTGPTGPVPDPPPGRLWRTTQRDRDLIHKQNIALSQEKTRTRLAYGAGAILGWMVVAPFVSLWWFGKTSSDVTGVTSDIWKSLGPLLGAAFLFYFASEKRA
jgi:hypothetical protein